MKLNDKELYIKLPLGTSVFVTIPNTSISGLSYNLFDRDDITDVGDYVFYKDSGTSLSGININALTSKLIRISGNYAFYRYLADSSGLTSVDFSNLDEVSGNRALYMGFRNLRNFSLSFPSLTKISGDYALYGLIGYGQVVSFDFSSLETISGSSALACAFDNTSRSEISSISFPSLANLTGSSALQNAFRYGWSNCTFYFPALTSFGSYTNQFNNMLSGCSNCTVHFPVTLQSTIGSWTDVTNGFGGTNTTILFDLNGGRMAYTSEDEETVYTADNTGVLQSPSVGDTMYKSANNIYSSESTIKSIEGNKIYLNDRNVQNNYTISSSGTFDLSSITSILLSLNTRPYASHTLIEYLDISGSVLTSFYISSNYQTSSWSSEAKYIRVSPNTSASDYTGNWNMSVTTTSYKTYPEPFKRDASKDIINYVS